MGVEQTRRTFTCGGFDWGSPARSSRERVDIRAVFLHHSCVSAEVLIFKCDRISS